MWAFRIEPAVTAATAGRRHSSITIETHDRDAERFRLIGEVGRNPVAGKHENADRHRLEKLIVALEWGRVLVLRPVRSKHDLRDLPIVGPLATKPAINTFGQKVGELQVSEKLKKATGIPFTLTDYSNPDDQKLANITMKYGDGPEPIKRSWLEDQFESMITDEEWYAGAEAFGKANRQMVLEDYEYLNDLTNEEYRAEMKSIAKAAREDAYDAVEKLRSKTLTRSQR